MVEVLLGLLAVGFVVFLVWTVFSLEITSSHHYRALRGRALKDIDHAIKDAQKLIDEQDQEGENPEHRD